ncbi:hypothetical protein PN419_00185 [Halorubrum ezzemoulense]|uniref:hypothetical protein n=1 Tax=Halorubrum ezzemoulense TaxID=337243 RepID=UPI00232E933D|nr:hypothetical protein [Halorubrum ezzemoulense]MDB9247424.1 hypothetical protein [Halorubrum ezzemoulense]MDB9258667.1 hypothetical protein [Halorubrum ezzemoulense]MDB9264475.1 hypothetical protein [Halorubrum ezzemoulense]MDB9269028.1 hypothetical protein [Halorubrum ezzemoulense]MDB9271443.1 hypothetical protein [Halorubrum ezzemoulense]
MLGAASLVLCVLGGGCLALTIDSTVDWVLTTVAAVLLIVGGALSVLAETGVP